MNQSATPGRVQQLTGSKATAVASDGTGSGQTLLSFTTQDSDVFPLTPTSNPRSQLTTPRGTVTEGRPFWESYEVYLPTNFPLARTNLGWLTFGSPFYGAPFAGSPSLGLQLDSGDWRWQGNLYAPGTAWEIYWQTPATLGKWTRFTWYVDPA
ncbi:MAG: hypothetical protein ACLP50_08695, partial [Solirubrobacteraceae bacterium]